MDKACDTFYWTVIRQILRRYGVPDAFVLVLSKLYSDIVIKLKGCGKNVSIPSTVSVKQGNNLAPIIFVFFIKSVGESISPEWGQAVIKDPVIQYYKQDCLK